MRTAVLTLLLSAGVGSAAPVPKRPPPDPFGRGYFGVYGRDVGDRPAVADAPEPHTPAGRAGLRAGDEFVRVGECAPRTFDELRAYVVRLRPGTRVAVVVRRNGAERALTVEVGNKADYPDTSGFPLPRDPFDPDR